MISSLRGLSMAYAIASSLSQIQNLLWRILSQSWPGVVVPIWSPYISSFPWHLDIYSALITTNISSINAHSTSFMSLCTNVTHPDQREWRIRTCPLALDLPLALSMLSFDFSLLMLPLFKKVSRLPSWLPRIFWPFRDWGGLVIAPC